MKPDFKNKSLKCKNSIMISLKALPPYLAHILTECERDEIKCPDFNVELINSSYI